MARLRCGRALAAQPRVPARSAPAARLRAPGGAGIRPHRAGVGPGSRPAAPAGARIRAPHRLLQHGRGLRVFLARAPVRQPLSGGRPPGIYGRSRLPPQPGGRGLVCAAGDAGLAQHPRRPRVPHRRRPARRPCAGLATPAGRHGPSRRARRAAVSAPCGAGGGAPVPGARGAEQGARGDGDAENRRGDAAGRRGHLGRGGCGTAGGCRPAGVHRHGRAGSGRPRCPRRHRPGRAPARAARLPLGPQPGTAGPPAAGGPGAAGGGDGAAGLVPRDGAVDGGRVVALGHVCPRLRDRAHLWLAGVAQARGTGAAARASRRAGAGGVAVRRRRMAAGQRRQRAGAAPVLPGPDDDRGGGGRAGPAAGPRADLPACLSAAGGAVRRSADRAANRLHHRFLRAAAATAGHTAAAGIRCRVVAGARAGQRRARGPDHRARSLERHDAGHRRRPPDLWLGIFRPGYLAAVPDRRPLGPAARRADSRAGRAGPGGARHRPPPGNGGVRRGSAGRRLARHRTGGHDFRAARRRRRQGAAPAAPARAVDRRQNGAHGLARAAPRPAAAVVRQLPGRRPHRVAATDLVPPPARTRRPARARAPHGDSGPAALARDAGRATRHRRGPAPAARAADHGTIGRDQVAGLALVPPARGRHQQRSAPETEAGLEQINRRRRQRRRNHRGRGLRRRPRAGRTRHDGAAGRHAARHRTAAAPCGGAVIRRAPPHGGPPRRPPMTDSDKY
uniref:Uncharacterized protein n=1 Tax=Tanacetum cinerariifolium TaxID=118510 RepID=A0A699GIH2_TANCI|nr:hypothetical protein [Tanacetum cinerariifolium]